MRTAGDCSLHSQKNPGLYVPFPLSRNVSCGAQQGWFVFNKDIYIFWWKKKVNKFSIHGCFMWSISVFGRAKNMVSKTNHTRCPANPRDGVFCANLCAPLVAQCQNKLSVWDGVEGCQGESYFGEEADILWIQHTTTQIPLESFKSCAKNTWKAWNWGRIPYLFDRWNMISEATMQCV